MATDVAHDIKEFWRQRAEQYGADQRATLGEVEIRTLEIGAIARRLRPGMAVLDVGCGNGYSTIEFARRHAVTIVGVDFVEEMITLARAGQSATSDLKGRVEFQVGNVLDLRFGDASFDAVVTERCLQNLPSFAVQREAIASIARVVRPGGLLLMAECSETGVDRVNRIVRRLRLQTISPRPWHNLFFDDHVLQRDPTICQLFRLREIVDFARLYTLATRVLGQVRGAGRLLPRLKPVLTALPQVVGVGYFKLYVWERRGSRSADGT